VWYREAVRRPALALALAGLLLAALDVGCGAAAPPVAIDEKVTRQASVGGRYSGLIKTVHAPSDRGTYGEFNEYGIWGPGVWAGAQQPRGYWVYVHPTWFIWEHKGAPAGTPVAQAAPPYPPQATAGGKYSGLIKTVEVPGDREQYGAFNDYGIWGPGDWAGKPQPRGYWVYVYPSWYIWANSSGATAGQVATAAGGQRSVTINGQSVAFEIVASMTCQLCTEACVRAARSANVCATAGSAVGRAVGGWGGLLLGKAVSRTCDDKVIQEPCTQVCCR
jgi:hypothetical protein